MSLLRARLAALLFLGLSGTSLALVLPEGLAVDAPESVDLTQQAITSAGAEKQVLAAWSGDTLRYFIRVEKPPPGSLDAQAYYNDLVNELRASGVNVEPGKRGDYPIGGGLLGSYLVVKTRLPAEARVDHTVVHFISNGKLAFVAVARLTTALSADQLVDETVALFKTARIAIPELPVGAKPGTGGP